MSDPLRTDRSRAGESTSQASRDAKIEQLLLAGLDHYFAGQYDQAINVWTRALFLDRSHARARAYIERARSAQAERQRESEALLHDGADAIQRGDSSEARRLLREAMTRGGPSDEVLVLLDRVSRLERGAAEPSPRPDAPEPPRLTLDEAPPARSRGAWIAIGSLVAVIVAAAIFAGSAVGPEWGALVERSLSRTVRTNVGAPVAQAALPAVPRRAEAAMIRAGTLVASGRLRDAITVLESVPATAPERPEADRLRADIQRQLIAIGPLSPQWTRAATDGLP